MVRKSREAVKVRAAPADEEAGVPKKRFSEPKAKSGRGLRAVAALLTHSKFAGRKFVIPGNRRNAYRLRVEAGASPPASAPGPPPPK